MAAGITLEDLFTHANITGVHGNVLPVKRLRKTVEQNAIVIVMIAKGLGANFFLSYSREANKAWVAFH